MSGFAESLRARIAQDGPVTVEAFMTAALAHYYGTRDPLGHAGDFITAPEVSQIFGELIALFLVQSWRDTGAPRPVQLVELGPGRGTLMSDIRRTLFKAGRDLAGAAQIHLVETSPALRVRQEALLGPDIHWHAGFGTVPPGPLLLVANEFFDALPVRQMIRTESAWPERRVGLDAQDRLIFVPSCDPADIAETSPAREMLTTQIARRIVRDGGVALLIDYGYTVSASGDTLQAVKSHGYADPLAEPGEADLTAHVDFAALARAAAATGAKIHGPVTQSAFLMALGLPLRVEQLKAKDPGAEDAARRLTADDQMGSLFKVMALSRIDASPLAGFP
jgi:NADH dehydrogenase [ubiquinone] 1 alpha subcomplex assembly factor 7